MLNLRIYRKNLIEGKSLIFGNKSQIEYIQFYSRVFQGIEPFHEIEWNYCQYWGKHTNSGKPKYRDCHHKTADAVYDWIPCPQCSRYHVLLIPFDPQGNWYDELISVDDHSKSFECWNCHLKFTVNEMRQVFVINPQ